MDMESPITRTSTRSSQGVLSHLCLRKASSTETVITRLGGSAGIADKVAIYQQAGFSKSLLVAHYALYLTELLIMCGICGWIRPSGLALRPVVRMNRLVSHRGPDGEGYWIWDCQSATGQFVESRLAD